MQAKKCKRIGADPCLPIAVPYGVLVGREVAALNRAGKLKYATVSRFAVGREYDLVIAALSFMSEVKI